MCCRRGPAYNIIEFVSPYLSSVITSFIARAPLRTSSVSAVDCCASPCGRRTLELTRVLNTHYVWLGRSTYRCPTIAPVGVRCICRDDRLGYDLQRGGDVKLARFRTLIWGHSPENGKSLLSFMATIQSRPLSQTPLAPCWAGDGYASGVPYSTPPYVTHDHPSPRRFL